MICLDQYYHQQKTTSGSFESFLAEKCQINTASMNTASFIIILLVCSLLTGVVVFGVLNLLWKKFRSRRYEDSRTAPRTARDEEVYIAGQKTWSQKILLQSLLKVKGHDKVKIEEKMGLWKLTVHRYCRFKEFVLLIKTFYWFIFLITDGLLSREDNRSIINYSDSLQVEKSTKTNFVQNL